MKKTFLSGVLLLSGFIWAPAPWAGPKPPAGPAPTIEFKQAAVAPFLMGKREPQLDEAMDNTLSCPLNEICVDDPTIAPNAGITLTRLTNAYLAQRFSPHIIPSDAVSKAYSAIILDEAQDSPRTLAQKLGKILDVDAIFVGTVWRYLDRGAIKEIPNSPASVGFAIYLIETRSGQQLWRGIYSLTQRPISENLFGAREQLKLGLKWRTAGEIAQIGVREVFSNFNPNGLP